MADEKFQYCNQVRFATSPWDILCYFQRVTLADPVTPGKGDPGMKVAEETTIAMSPMHAKVMLRLLYENLEAYEEHAGPIPLAKDEQAKWSEFVKKVKAL